MMQLFSQKRRTIYRDNYTNSARSMNIAISIEKTNSITFTKDHKR